jgi:replicative DNA helicase
MSNIPKPPINTQTVPKSSFVAISTGKIPPNAIELEKAVLGAFLNDSKVAKDIFPILFSRMFYLEKHNFIFKAMETLFEQKVGIDILTVSTELQRIGKLGFIGGDFYLIGLSQMTATAAHVEFHSRIIVQKYILRELIKTSSKAIETCYTDDPDVFRVMDYISSSVKHINDDAVLNHKGPLSDSQEAKKELREKRQMIKEGKTSGVYTGIREFDSWCGGFQRRELITIAARPGIGKTTCVISVAWNAAMLKKIPVTFVTLEMSSRDVKNRIASRITKIPFSRIHNANITNEEEYLVFKAYDVIDASALTIIDTSTHKNIYENIEAIIDEQVANGSQLVIIDYVQLMKLRQATSNDTSDLKHITRGLKAKAIECNVPIIQLSQLGRQVDQRPDKTPYLADLKQSGSIEEDSDTVIFLSRDAYYQILQMPGLILTMSEIGKTKMIIAKGRNIGTGMFITFLDFINYDWCSYLDRTE